MKITVTWDMTLCLAGSVLSKHWNLSNYMADTSQKTAIIIEGSFFKYKPLWKGLTHSLPVLQADLLT